MERKSDGVDEAAARARARRLKTEGGARARGRGLASEEESEQKRQARFEAKRQKELNRANEKRERTMHRMRRHMMKMGLKASVMESIAANVTTNAETARQLTSAPSDLVDLSLLPIGHNLPLPPLLLPTDAFSFDGRFGISILLDQTQTRRRDVPTICRFNFAPAEDAPVLMGEAGIKDPAKALLYPSLCAAAKRANLKPGMPPTNRCGFG
jgi:hypothetical protein